MPQQIRIGVKRPKERVMVIDLSGPLDSTSALQLEKEITGLITRPVMLVVNLANVPSMTSAGLGVILTAALEARRYEGDVRLCCPSASVTKVMKLVGLFELFKVFDTEEEALEDL